MRDSCLVTALALFSIYTDSAAAGCNFSDWDTYKETQLIREKLKGPYIYSTTTVHVDADGAPNAYHPNDVGLHCTEGVGFKGLDCPANGGYPNSRWWRDAIVPDPNDNNKGYVQNTGYYKGFFISKTSLMDTSKLETDTSKYVDSTRVPYIVFPGNFLKKRGTGNIGDFGYALNIENGKSSEFIVAESGPEDSSLGEMSIKLANGLGGCNSNPRTGHGVPEGKIIYVVFPYTKLSPSWPLSEEELEENAKSLLKSIGGIDALYECAKYL